MYAGKRRQLDINRLLEDKIDEILERKLGAQTMPVLNLGTIDSRPPFDVENAVRKYSDPQKVMNEWFKHEGRRVPKDYAVIFFQGWESFNEDERIEALRDAKKVLDRSLKKPKKA